MEAAFLFAFPGIIIAGGACCVRFLSEKEKARYQAARELGLMEKLLEVGWSGLSCAESGKIGGYLSRRKQKEQIRK